jgi:two-component system sensor histidine kinase YesM
MKSKSLRKTIQNSYIFIIFVMLIPAIYSLIFSHVHRKQYDSIIRNVSLANQINMIVKDQVTIELWNIVSGSITFNQGNQYTLLGTIDNGIDELLQNTAEGNKQKLEVAKRTLVTLHNNISTLGQQIARDESVKATEIQLDEIRSIASLLSDILQEFIILEIESAAQTNRSLQHTSITMTIIQAFIVMLVMIV